MIPQASPSRRIARFADEVRASFDAVLGGDAYILGAGVAAFEEAFAAHCGASHCIGVGSGTDAIRLALLALRIGPGDEVIVPALTFSGTAQAILQCGARPHFVDVDAGTRCLDPSACSAAVNDRTTALLPVHLFGQACDMPALMRIATRHGLAVVEDCAQAHGAQLAGRPLGSFGHAAAFSFYPTKNLGCIGDGGAVVTSDEGLADRLLRLRNYGFGGRDRISLDLGFNSRLDELQAAVLLVLLPHLARGNEERRTIAGRYDASLAGCGLGLPHRDAGHVYHQYAVTSPDRDGLRGRLAGAGVATAVHYAPGLHRHPAFAEARCGDLGVTEALCASLLSLPIQPEVATPDLDRIIAAVVGACPA